MNLVTLLLLVASSVVVLNIGRLKGEDPLYNAEKELTNEFIKNGPYMFIMQGDCSLALYVRKDKARDRSL